LGDTDTRVGPPLFVVQPFLTTLHPPNWHHDEDSPIVPVLERGHGPILVDDVRFFRPSTARTDNARRTGSAGGVAQHAPLTCPVTKCGGPPVLSPFPPSSPGPEERTGYAAPDRWQALTRPCFAEFRSGDPPESGTRLVSFAWFCVFAIRARYLATTSPGRQLLHKGGIRAVTSCDVRTWVGDRVGSRPLPSQPRGHANGGSRIRLEIRALP